MAAIFRTLTDYATRTAMQLALEFYGPMYLLYSVYDGAADQLGCRAHAGRAYRPFYCQSLKANHKKE